MSKIDKIPVRLYEGCVGDRKFMSKDEALKYVKDFLTEKQTK